MGMEDDFLLEDEDDEKTIEFIKNYLSLYNTSFIYLIVLTYFINAIITFLIFIFNSKIITVITFFINISV